MCSEAAMQSDSTTTNSCCGQSVYFAYRQLQSTESRQTQAATDMLPELKGDWLAACNQPPNIVKCTTQLPVRSSNHKCIPYKQCHHDNHKKYFKLVWKSLCHKFTQA